MQCDLNAPGNYLLRKSWGRGGGGGGGGGGGTVDIVKGVDSTLP